MLHELDDDFINEFNQVDLSEATTQTNYLGQLQKYTAIYQSLPPIISTGIGYAIMHPEINLNGLDLNSDQRQWNQNCYHGGGGMHSSIHNGRDPHGCYEWNAEHGRAFVDAFGPPLLGYLVGVVLWQSALIIACTTNRELSFNKKADPCERMKWNVMFTQSKLSCPPAGTVANAFATTFWSSTVTVVYALLGAKMLGLIPDEHAAADLAATHAVGGAVIPGLVTSAHIIYRIFAYGEFKWCPPPGYYTSKIPTCRALKNISLPSFKNVTPPSLNCWPSCVSFDISREEVQAAIPVDLNALLDARQREEGITWASASTSLLRPWGGDAEEQAESGKRRATAPMLFSDAQVSAGSVGSWTGDDTQQQRQQSQPNRASRFGNCVVS